MKVFKVFYVIPVICLSMVLNIEEKAEYSLSGAYISAETVKSINVLKGKNPQAKEYQTKFNLPDSTDIIVITLQ